MDEDLKSGSSVVNDEESASSKSLKKKRKPRKGKKRLSSRLRVEKMIKDRVFEDAEKDNQELELETLVFGGEYDILDQLNQDFSGKHKKKKVDLDADVEDKKSDSEIESSEKTKQKKPAWEDEDDEDILVSDKASTFRRTHKSIIHKATEKYKDFARKKFQTMTGNPRWADLGKTKATSDSEDDDENSGSLLQKTGNFLEKSLSLPTKEIDIRKCGCLRDEQGGLIKTTEFHPLSRVAVTAGFSGTATLYQIDGKENSKIQSVHFQNFPITTSHFSNDGTELIVGSKEYGHFFSYDMIYGKIRKIYCERDMQQKNFKRFHFTPDGKLIVVQGRFGNIYLLSAKSKEWIGTMAMNGAVIAVAFNKHGSRMYTYGEFGDVYVWDMETRSCIHRFVDEGCLTGTAIATSPNDQFIACGSDSGVVNIYDSSDVLATSNPTPLKVIMNLTTEVTSMKFNSTSEILVMASQFKPNSLRLLHFPSMSIFSNFPRLNSKFGLVNCLDISTNSGYLVFGNTRGKAYLYRLRHFSNY